MATALLAVGQAAGAQLPTPAPAKDVGMPAECTVEFQPDTLTIRERPARVLARLPRALGEPLDVEVPDASGLEVLDTEADGDGGTWIVGVYLGAAVPGRWTLVLTGSEGECRGTLTTRMPGSVRRGAGRFDHSTTPRGGDR